jgi:hypothetical protein
MTNLTLGPRLMLVSIAHALAEDLADPRRSGWSTNGLSVRQPVIDAPDIELFIAAPTDLLGYASLSATTILKPAALPLDLAEVLPGRINARLKTDPVSQRLSHEILAAIAAIRNPAPKASVV